MSEMLDVVIVGGGFSRWINRFIVGSRWVQATVLDAAPVLDQDKTLA